MSNLRKAAEDLVVTLKGHTLPTSAKKAMYVLTQALAQDNKFSETDPCQTENEEDMCSLCNCWKKTREMCS